MYKLNTDGLRSKPALQQKNTTNALSRKLRMGATLCAPSGRDIHIQLLFTTVNSICHE
jgi:hypothetical protein